jgi:hypothetical protein
MKTEPAIKDLYQTVRTMIRELNNSNVSISEDREEEIHEFYVRYSNMSSKYLLENCVQCPVFDDPPLYVFYDSMLQLETAYRNYQDVTSDEFCVDY